MKGGIPQGSALGPLLFLLYINTLPSVITSGVIQQYADDTTLICSGPSPSEVAATLNHQLSLVNGWLVDNRMKLNLSKSCVMWFCIPRRNIQHPLPDIMINHTTLQTAKISRTGF